MKQRLAVLPILLSWTIDYPAFRRLCKFTTLIIVFAIATGQCGLWTLVAAPRQPNVLLIVSEDNDPSLGCYGEPHVRTPHLDKLAAEGVRFENAFVPYSVCSPSRACFLTGLWPQQNGQLGLATHKFAMFEGVPHVFSHLKKAGYRTGLIGKLHVNPESAFDPFIDYRAIKSANFNKRNMREYAAAAAEFFNNNYQKARAQPLNSTENREPGTENAAQTPRPFFLSINYPDAHFPILTQEFGSPAEPLTGDDVTTLARLGVDSPRLREATANYYNCMMRLDDGIKMLLKELEQSGHKENTLVIYISDHGAQFSRGKTSAYEGGLRIPMIVRWPGHAKPGLVRDELVSTLDILPTLLHAAGVSESSVTLAGFKLQPLLAGAIDAIWRPYLVGITSGAAPSIWHPQFSIRDARYKLIINPFPGMESPPARQYLEHAVSFWVAGTGPEEIAAAPPAVQKAYAEYLVPPRYQLYDLKNDPHEFVNLATKNPEIRDRLIETFDAWQKKIDDPLADPALLKRLNDEVLAARDTNYRKDKSFRWRYLDYLK